MSTTPAALLATMAQLQREVKLLRDRETRRKEERRQLRINRTIDRAHLDALALVTLHVGGGNVGREYACLPQRRWCYAAALLRLAGIASDQRDLSIKFENQDDLLAKLDYAAKLAKLHPSYYVTHLPPFNVPKMLQPTRNL